MENLISRYRNVSILVAVLFAQVLGLAVQVRRTSENESSRLIRIWAVDAVTPLEKGIVWCQSSVRNIWRNYFYLRGVRQENRDLKEQIQRLEIQQVRLNEDAEQARRLQVLLGFKEQYISKTVAAQIIGSSGSDQSRSVYIDKGARDGIRPDMAVITADGVVGKVLKVFGTQPFEASVSQVLLINDQTSGVGAILEKSRLQGVLRGTPTGEVMLEKVMSDETVEPGEKILTSGGDRIFPKGLPVGTVSNVSPGPELFLNIRVKPAVNLGKLEEVLVITQQEEREPEVAAGTRMRAADILAQRLPSVPETKPLDNPFAPPPPTSALAIAPSKPVPPGGNATNKPASSGSATLGSTASANPKPSGAAAASTTNSATAKPAANSSAIKPATGQKPVLQVVRQGTPANTEGKVNAKPAQPEPGASQPPAASAPPQTQPQDQPQ